MTASKPWPAPSEYTKRMPLNVPVTSPRYPRNLFCEKYDTCLDTAIKKDWKSFSCTRCAHRLSLSEGHKEQAIAAQVQYLCPISEIVSCELPLEVGLLDDALQDADSEVPDWEVLTK